jgi:thiamine kinase-like enzyme
VVEQETLDVVGSETPGHQALEAWRKLRDKRQATGKISLLKKRFKSTIYRIDEIGRGASSIVAKYCRREVAAHERIIYERILPELPISSPRYYGYVEGEKEYDWLFLEYAHGEQYSRFRDDHSIPVARWLGRLHSSAANVPTAAQLPDRNHRHHLTLLLEARKKLQSNLRELNLPTAELAIIEAAISQCDFLESHWKRVEEWCNRMPGTLVHGDFKPRNVVIRRGPRGSAVLPFDWEASGWGMPASDLAYIDLAAYHEIVKHRWPTVNLEDVQSMKIIGRIFRGLEEFRWESEKFDPSWEVSTIKLQIYHARMTEAIEMTRW